MTWQLRHHGATVAFGTYANILDTAEEWQVLERAWHPDGTEFAPRWRERGWAIVPVQVEAGRVAA